MPLLYKKIFITMNNFTKTFLVSFSKPYYIKNSNSDLYKLISYKNSIDNSEYQDFSILTKNLEYLGFRNVIIVTVSKNPRISSIREEEPII